VLTQTRYGDWPQLPFGSGGEKAQITLGEKVLISRSKKRLEGSRWKGKTQLWSHNGAHFRDKKRRAIHCRKKEINKKTSYEGIKKPKESRKPTPLRDEGLINCGERSLPHGENLGRGKSSPNNPHTGPGGEKGRSIVQVRKGWDPLFLLESEERKRVEPGGVFEEGQ